MTVLQNGFPKSGNYWLFNILTKCLDAGGVPPKSFVRGHPIQSVANTWLLSYPDQSSLDVLDIEPGKNYLRIASYFREPIEDIDVYIDANRLVWTHSHYHSYSAEVYRRFQKSVYIIRDPRDAAISMAHFAFTPYRMKTDHNPFRDVDDYLASQLGKHVSGWCNHVGSHLLAMSALGDHMLVVFYEDLKADTQGQITKIALHLGLSLEATKIEQIVDDVSVSSMKKKSATHVRSGKSGGWQQALDSQQVKLAARIAGPLMDELGYSRTISDDTFPRLPERLNSKRIKSAMRRAMIYRGISLVRGNRGALKEPGKVLPKGAG
jgi:aryl sulfotransferase